MIALEHVSKQFEGKRRVTALDDVSLEIPRGQMVAIIGPSGSGKSTLLNLIGGLDQPDGGTVRVDGTEVTGLDDEGLSRLRRDSVSYVFQTFGLVPALTAAENVGVPLRLRRTATRPLLLPPRPRPRQPPPLPRDLTPSRASSRHSRCTTPLALRPAR